MLVEQQARLIACEDLYRLVVGLVVYWHWPRRASC